MKIKAIIEEDFINYKKTSMLLGTCFCNWKCLKEKNLDISICQNIELARTNIIDIPNDKIIKRYIENSITHAIVIAGLEPFLQFQEVYDFIRDFREQSQDDVVIYTGYYPDFPWYFRKRRRRIL